jgi:hypothetical protein
MLSSKVQGSCWLGLRMLQVHPPVPEEFSSERRGVGKWPPGVGEAEGDGDAVAVGLGGGLVTPKVAATASAPRFATTIPVLCAAASRPLDADGRTIASFT